MRPDAKNYQLLLEERSIRQGLAQFLDGAVGIATGADNSSPLLIHRAWDQFTNRKSNSTDATGVLSLDSKKEMTELLRATSILTLLEKGDQLELARKVACPLLSETPQTGVEAVNADLIKQFQMAQSPVLKFALARFAEELATSVGSIASKENEALRQWAKAANKETHKDWIASPILQDRYPSLFAGSKQMMDRLDSPKTALAIAQLARIQSRYADAKKVLEKASKTFPGNTTVLERLFEIDAELVELGLIDPEKAKQILVRLQSGPSTAGMEVLRGQLFETLGQADKAAIAYKAALVQKVDPKWTPLAEVRLAVLVSQAAFSQK
jgi:tetratricopeptide (TPR) repeat protein